MYHHLSRAIYRDLVRNLPAGGSPAARQRILEACEATIERLVTDPELFAHPARTLFQDVRTLYPMTVQARLWQTLERDLEPLAHELRERPELAHALAGTTPSCQATTRSSTPCRREPVGGTPYCPSHQHLLQMERFEERLEHVA